MSGRAPLHHYIAKTLNLAAVSVYNWILLFGGASTLPTFVRIRAGRGALEIFITPLLPHGCAMAHLLSSEAIPLQPDCLSPIMI